MGQIKYRIKVSTLTCSVTILIAVFLVGCATTSPQAKFQQALPKEMHVDANDTVTVRVQASKDVVAEEADKQRLSQRIKEKIDIQKMNNAVAGEKREYELEVLLTQYEKGNAFARAMLAGLGQIHIGGHISVLALPERAKVAEFDIDKTFAWGGIYGASTSIEDVEQGFAEGVAEALTKAAQ